MTLAVEPLFFHLYTFPLAIRNPGLSVFHFKGKKYAYYDKLQTKLNLNIVLF